MTVNRKLPELGTSEWEILVKDYPTASFEQLDIWANKYGYSNRHQFVGGMKKQGIHRRLMPTYGERIAAARAEARGDNQPLLITLPKEFKAIAVINDTQNPFQDKISLSLVETFLFEAQPDILVYNGDCNDFYQISKFDKDPRRIADLQSDVDNTKAMFCRQRKGLPNTRMVLVDGNHEDRWQKFLWTKAPELSSLTCLTTDELFSLKEYDIEHVNYECGIKINDIFLIIHGNLASVHSSYTAKRMFEKHGGCGICAHTHRGGSYYKRNRFGTWGWWENFCLCSLYPDWIQNPDWVQGFSLIHFRGKRFWIEQIPIIDHAFIYGGKIYESGNGK